MLTRLSLALAVTMSASAALAETQIKPLAVSVGSPALANMDFEMRPGGVSAGVSVHLLLTGLDTPIVDVDEDASTLTKAADSTGKDLLVEPPRGEGVMMMTSSPGVGPFPAIAQDGKAAVVELTVPQTPAVGATAMTFEGALSVTVASGVRSASAEGVALAPGKFTVGEQEFEITDVAKHDWEEGKSKLVIRTTKAAIDGIAGWKITDPAGNVIADGPYSTMTMMDTVEVELSLESKPETATISLDLYEGMQKVEVPFSVEVGLGLE